MNLAGLSATQRARLTYARASAAVFRFRTLQRANALFTSVAPEGPVARPFCGHTLWLDVRRSTYHRLLFLEGERMIAERRIIMSLLRDGMTVVDVGANIGYYALMFERAVGPGGRIICIEPSRENLAELRLNVEGNGLGNVEILECAVGSQDGETGLRGGINTGVVPVGSGESVVPLRRLDSLVYEPIDLLKIDVEGYEGQVIEGAAGLIAEHRPAIFLEMHPHILPRHGFSTEGIIEWLRNHYPVVEIFASTESTGSVVERVVRRYAVAAVKRVSTTAFLEADRDRGDEPRTFWVVCRPSRRDSGPDETIGA